MEAMASVPPRPTTLHPPGADTLIDGAGPRSALCTHLARMESVGRCSLRNQQPRGQKGAGVLVS
eukprot:COSAG01_NODE_68952_length_262_cov_2.263804_1_plen_63_part_10